MIWVIRWGLTLSLLVSGHDPMTVEAPPPIVLPAIPAHSIPNIIAGAARIYGVDPLQFMRVAVCESHLNPDAVNPESGASGVFQFLPSTWAANAPRAGYPNGDVFDPVANVMTAAWMFRHGQSWQWVCK